MKNRPPTPAEVDTLAGRFEFLMAELEAAKQRVDPVHDALVSLVKKHGTPHATKSKILIGNEYECVVSKRHSVHIEMPALGRLREALKMAGKSHLFRFLFEREEKFSVASTADETLAKPVTPKNVRDLYHQAVRFVPKSDALDVRERKQGK